MTDERQYEEMKATREELEDLERLTENLEKAIEEVKKTTKDTLVSLTMRCLVTTCAYVVVKRAADAFLPKSVSGPIKALTLFGTYFIPEIIGSKAGKLTEKIMEEE